MEGFNYHIQVLWTEIHEEDYEETQVGYVGCESDGTLTVVDTVQLATVFFDLEQAVGAIGEDITDFFSVRVPYVAQPIPVDFATHGAMVSYVSKRRVTATHAKEVSDE